MKDKGGANAVFEVLDRSSLYSIGIISTLISLLSLVVPIAAQTLINIVAFGKLLQPVITLSVIVFILMVGLGLLSVWQMLIIEIIQQKLMVRISLKLAKHFTHLSPAIFSTHNGPELVNRFFEIVVINKALASLLLYGITLGLQMTFGLILLLFYHPLFLFFDGFIIISLLLVIFIPYRIAASSAKEECAQKHVTGSWLEEILINRYLFKYNEYPRYVMEQADKRLVGFLKARNRHFRQLVKHQIGLYALSALATSLLLGLGGYLIINNQLSLGQLVASEIVLGTLIYGFKRLGALLENYYDLIASTEKIDFALNVPLENYHSQEFANHLLPSMKSIHLGISDIRLCAGSGSAEVLLSPVEASPAKPLLLVFKQEDACKNFVESLSGLNDILSAAITVNGIPCTQATLIALRRHSLLIREPQWFAGSIYQNLVLNHAGVSIEAICELLKKLHLLEKIMQCPDGLNTLIHDWQTVFTLSELIQLMVARAIIDNPRLLIIDRSLDDLQEDEMDRVMPLLLAMKHTTLVITTLKNQIPQLPDQVVCSL
ncbi:ABC transporter transmembrane domain-containing protein [Legionella sp. CNM-4043-24]|uniref:ABC transporter transmembrane domain-containing protein n=1 Tax=Legionella sp. CNM-4043-24 TaxID=3421646 RepID=UPI00403AA2C0